MPTLPRPGSQHWPFLLLKTILLVLRANTSSCSSERRLCVGGHVRPSGILGSRHIVWPAAFQTCVSIRWMGGDVVRAGPPRAYRPPGSWRGFWAQAAAKSGVAKSTCCRGHVTGRVLPGCAGRRARGARSAPHPSAAQTLGPRRQGRASKCVVCTTHKPRPWLSACGAGAPSTPRKAQAIGPRSGDGKLLGRTGGTEGSAGRRAARPRPCPAGSETAGSGAHGADATSASCRDGSGGARGCPGVPVRFHASPSPHGRAGQRPLPCSGPTSGGREGISLSSFGCSAGPLV